MRNALWAIVMGAMAAAPGHAAWVWVYEGERHVVMPPEEGQPPWASYPDEDGNGLPDPIITHLSLRVEDESGSSVSRIRVGKTIHLIAEPELGGLETETLTVAFHLRGPAGAMPVVPATSIRDPLSLGTAPATYRASYTIPEDPPETYVGDYEATVEISIGATKMLPEATEPVALKVVGPRESTSEKVKRKVKSGLEEAGDDLRDFGGDVVDEIGEIWGKATEEAPPGSLREVQPRETAGMAHKLAKLPTSPMKQEMDALGLDRAGALRSKDGPARSVVVIPYDQPRGLTAEGWIPLGYLTVSGLAISDLDDPTPSMQWTSGRETTYALALEMQPGDVEGYVHIIGPDGTSLGRVLSDAEWFAKMVFPSDTQIRQRRHPDAEEGGSVMLKLVVPLPTGSVRPEFELPVVGTE